MYLKSNESSFDESAMLLHDIQLSKCSENRKKMYNFHDSYAAMLERLDPVFFICQKLNDDIPVGPHHNDTTFQGLQFSGIC